MACHEASHGSCTEYLDRFIDWCQGDPDGNESWTAESIQAHWESFDCEADGGVTRASWFKVLDYFGHGELVRELDLKAFTDDPPPEMTEAEKEVNSAAIANNNRPIVMCEAGKLPQMVRKTQTILIEDGEKPDALASDHIFQRGGILVHLSRNQIKPGTKKLDDPKHEENALMIVEAVPGWLADRSERSIMFAVPTKKSKKDDGSPKLQPIDMPAKLIDRLETITTSWKFPTLAGTVETPTLRRDGSVLDKLGYDKASGLYYDPAGVMFPEIKARPSRKECLAALGTLMQVLQDFPFQDDDGIIGLSLSVALAGMLTAVVRRSLPIAPAFGISADEVEAGKTLLAQVLANIATGRAAGARPLSGNEEERRKTFGAAFFAGDAVILFDNVDAPIQGATFNEVLTSETFRDRRLGKNDENIQAPTNALIVLTGNKLTAKGDMTSRIMLCRIVPDKALLARTFAHPDLQAYVIEHRPEIVAAALTILRGYLVAKDRNDGPTNRFRAWRTLIADALIWLGLPDPCLSSNRVREADPVKEDQAAVVTEWARAIGEASVTTAELFDRLDIVKAAGDVLDIELSRMRPRKLAEYLKTLVGLTVAGYKVRGTKDAHGVFSWRIECTDPALRVEPQPAANDNEADGDFTDEEPGDDLADGL